MEPITTAPITCFAEQPRSGKWPAVRDAHLEREPCCQVCWSKHNLNVHHKKPYHLYPSLELEDSNLITLCEGGPVNCHILFGHLMNWASYNIHVDADTETWRNKMTRRPTTAAEEPVRFEPDDTTEFKACTPSE